VYGETGTWFEQDGNQSCALAAFQRAVQLEPQSGQAPLGAALVRARQLSTAAAEFRLACEYQPGMAIAHSSLGSVLMDLGKPKEADAEFREGLRLAPQLEPALLALACSEPIRATINRLRDSFAKPLNVIPRMKRLTSRSN
jgi:Flp pilus assembly protein TadD